jgi:hypothetical protein
MNIQRNWGFVLLALWLIAVGMISVFALSFREIDLVLGIVAILAGLFILVGK